MNTTHSQPVLIGAGQAALAGNKVIRNTYLLLSMTLLFSAAVAGLGETTDAGDASNVGGDRSTRPGGPTRIRGPRSP